MNIENRNERLRDLDAQLSDCVRQLRKLDEQHADTEQACKRARAAKGKLAVFSETGVEGLQQAGRDRQLWTESNRAAESIAQSIQASKEREGGLRMADERTLAKRGLEAAKFKEVQDLNRRASLLSSYETELERIEDRRTKTGAVLFL